MTRARAHSCGWRGRLGRALAAIPGLLGLLVVASGCAQNAILELEIDLPQRPSDTPIFAFVQARRGDTHPFESDWGGDDLPAVELLPDQRHTTTMSLIADEDGFDAHLKVRFCGSPKCTDIADGRAPARWYRIEHPFYVGERTFWQVSIAAVPTTPDGALEEVDRCAIRGCIEGTLSSYCDAAGRHFCAQ